MIENFSKKVDVFSHKPDDFKKKSTFEMQTSLFII